MTETRERIRARAAALGANEEQFRDRLFGLRAQHGLTQEQVAARMGVSQSVVARLEGFDSNPTLSTLRRYALAVEARLNFSVASDRPYTTATLSDVPSVYFAAATSTTDLDWSILKVGLDA